MADPDERRDLRLPSFFPLTVPACKKQTDEFFKCFEDHSRMKHEKDMESAKTALGLCEAGLKAYTKCMENSMNQKPKKFLGLF
jgi:hypothetical protein